MKIVETQLPGVWSIQPKVENDHRGNFMELFIEKDYDVLPPGVHFVYHCLSTSAKGVLRGVHYSPHCWKIYSCLRGAIYYVFINLDPNDSEYLKQGTFLLKPYEQILKHPKYGAGMLALEDDTLLYYAQSQYYNPNDPDQYTYKCDDPKLNIWWPTKTPILSKRDDQGHYDGLTR